MRSSFFSLAAFVLIFFAPGAADAQLHADVGLEPGVMRRIMLHRGTDGTNPFPDAGFGPMLELHAHVAILPLLRAGLYVSHDISPELSSRQFTSFGLRAKVTPPILCGNWRTWAFTGVGYSLVYAPSYNHDFQLGTVAVAGQAGSFFEIPLGIGLGYKLRKPWELTAELGGKIGFGFSGDLYCEGTDCNPNGSAPRNPPIYLPVAGYDTLAVYLALGVSLDL